MEKAMRMCPNCKVELKKKRYKGVSVDECEQCHGIFFDRGELETAKDHADPDVRFIDFVLFDIKNLNKLQQEQKDCPKCAFAMEPLEYAGSKIVINKCPNCHGVWLDKGEFDRIISYLETLVSKQSSAELADDIKQQLVEVLVGPKNEMEELRDLAAVTRLFEERWVAEHPTVAKILDTYYSLTPLK